MHCWGSSNNELPVNQTPIQPMKIALLIATSLMGTLAALGSANIPSPPVPEASTSGALAFLGLAVAGTIIRRRKRQP